MEVTELTTVKTHIQLCWIITQEGDMSAIYFCLYVDTVELLRDGQLMLEVIKDQNNSLILNRINPYRKKECENIPT